MDNDNNEINSNNIELLLIFLRYGDNELWKMLNNLIWSSSCKPLIELNNLGIFLYRYFGRNDSQTEEDLKEPNKKFERLRIFLVELTKFISQSKAKISDKYRKEIVQVVKEVIKNNTLIYFTNNNRIEFVKLKDLLNGKKTRVQFLIVKNGYNTYISSSNNKVKIKKIFTAKMSYKTFLNTYLIVCNAIKELEKIHEKDNCSWCNPVSELKNKKYKCLICKDILEFIIQNGNYTRNQLNDKISRCGKELPLQDKVEKRKNVLLEILEEINKNREEKGIPKKELGELKKMIEAQFKV